MKQIVLLLAAGAILASCNQTKTEPAPAAEAKVQPIELIQTDHSQQCKEALGSLSSGDVDGFLANMADNAVYRWNSGDSIVGKEALLAYWKDRRTNAIDKIEFSNDVWLTVQVNESQQVAKGIWVLGWYRTTATYKTGKSMSQWIHTDYHFDANNKIDQVIQYLDRAPITAAMTK